MLIDGAGQAAHGVESTERVIEIVRRDPDASVLDYRNIPWVVGTRRPMSPDMLGELVFPSGRPLSPSLRAWLAFDTTLLERHGWFDAHGGLAPRPLDELVDAELGPPWASEFAPLARRFPECFLLPGGSDSRRVLAVGDPDSTGEYPVLAVDVDDLPFVGLMYPGFDVYLAHTAGLFTAEFPTYTALSDHEVYGRRMREHARLRLGGDSCAEWPF